MGDAGLSRRDLLVAGGLLTAAGCTRGNAPQPPEPPDPDVAIRAEVIDGVSGLKELYDVVAAAHPSLGDQLAPFAAETAAHLLALQPAGTPSPAGSPTRNSPSPSATVTAPATAAEARQALSQAERDGAEARVRQLGKASPALARLVAAIGASEATHATLLAARG